MNDFKKCDLIGIKLGIGLTKSSISSPLILDNFVGPDGLSIINHKIWPVNIPETSWSYLGGSIDYVKLNSDHAKSLNASVTSYYTLNSGLSDCKISADIYIVTGNVHGLIFRVTDINNYWWAQFDSSINYARVYEQTSGSTILRIDGGIGTAPNGQVVRMEIILSDTLITFKVPGFVGNYNSNVRKTSFLHGMYFFGSIGYIDNFRIDPLTIEEYLEGRDVPIHASPIIIYVDGV